MTGWCWFGSSGRPLTVRHALERWLEWQHLDSLAGMIGRASFEASPDPNAIERAHDIRTLQSWTR